MDGSSSITVIVPTYRERQNLPLLTEKLGEVRQQHSLDLKVLLMDDDSQDGTVEWCADSAPSWVELVVRTDDRGLSPSVVDGINRATSDYVVVMDADLSHPPEKIPELIESLENDSQFVIGSRYVKGASTDENWGLFRWINSRAATLLARPLTSAKDPMAGFFAFRRELFEVAVEINPIGYKIGLELLVKCNVSKVSEVPIHFSDRQFGESKLNFTEQVKYIRHLGRLYKHRVNHRRAA